MVTSVGQLFASFFLPLAPTAQMRPRFSRFTGVTYKDKSQVAHEKELDALLIRHAPTMPLACPVSVQITSLVRISISAPKSRREAMTGLIELPAKKPDLDNYIKQILDGMTRCKFWEDDDLVCEIHARKIYAAVPGWKISIRECVFNG